MIVLFSEQLRDPPASEFERAAGRGEARFGSESSVSGVCRYDGEHHGNSVRCPSREALRDR